MAVKSIHMGWIASRHKRRERTNWLFVVLATQKFPHSTYLLQPFCPTLFIPFYSICFSPTDCLIQNFILVQKLSFCQPSNYRSPGHFLKVWTAFENARFKNNKESICNIWTIFATKKRMMNLRCKIIVLHEEKILLACVRIFI